MVGELNIEWPMSNADLEAAIESAWRRLRSTGIAEPIHAELSEQLVALLGIQKRRAFLVSKSLEGSK